MRAFRALAIAALGLGLYAWHMRKTVAATLVAIIDTRPLAPPITGPTERL